VKNAVHAASPVTSATDQPRRRVADEEAEPVEESSPVSAHEPYRRLRPHEQPDEGQRNEVGGGIDDDHPRRPEPRDQEAGCRRPEQQRDALRSLKECIRLADDPLVLADELRDDRALGGEVRAGQSAEAEHEDEQERERERAAPVQ
jgi:hypothetical protein